ncbi:MAG: hypothetical protein Q9204_006092, partial [Flavoplaca sp. TL-2023a]
ALCRDLSSRETLHPTDPEDSQSTRLGIATASVLVNTLTQENSQHYQAFDREGSYQCVIEKKKDHSLCHASGDINFFYARKPISRCPHAKFADVVAPQRFLNSIQCYQQNLDPVLDYELKDGKRGKDECKYCQSSFQAEMSGVGDEMGLRVRCIGLLGRADSPKDPIWLSQCVGSMATKGPGDGFRSLSTALLTMKAAFDRVVRKFP